MQIMRINCGHAGENSKHAAQRNMQTISARTDGKMENREAIFMQKRPFAPFCTLWRSFADLRLRSFALVCSHSRVSAFDRFTTTAFKNCRWKTVH